MSNQFIQYRDGYKYQLAFEYQIKINIKPKLDINIQFVKLDTQGYLIIADGYAWDGPSGPVIDTDENLRASLVHDALYQLMRYKKLNAKDHKDKADKIFKNICIEDGVNRAIAHAYYLVLKAGGKPATDPKNKKKTHQAP